MSAWGSASVDTVGFGFGQPSSSSEFLFLSTKYQQNKGETPQAKVRKSPHRTEAEGKLREASSGNGAYPTTRCAAEAVQQGT